MSHDVVADGSLFSGSDVMDFVIAWLESVPFIPACVWTEFVILHLRRYILGVN